MIQFTLVLSATKARKTRMAGLEDQDEDEEEEEEPSGSQSPQNFFQEDEKPKSNKFNVLA